MNPLKIKILATLTKHPNKWVRTKNVAKELGLSTKEGINKVSVLLYRLRRLPNIERRNNSHDYQYRYFEAIKHHPTPKNTLTKLENDKKARGDSDNFDNFTFVERLPQVTEGFCEFCGTYGKISFKAEKEDRHTVFLCGRHGKVVDKKLCGYGGVYHE